MAFFPKIKTKEKNGRYDLEIDEGRIKIYFMEKYATIQLMADVLVGIFFVAGSVLNLSGTPALYGNIAYLIGSLSLAIRPVLKIVRRTWVYKNREE